MGRSSSVLALFATKGLRSKTQLGPIVSYTNLKLERLEEGMGGASAYGAGATLARPPLAGAPKTPRLG